ncbi:MAG TPA: hypothetical protein IGS52_16930 [Oscillatoriaceae cyanobacterium M33_DOE_052]|uniref:Uncharacterized protein n=1 Tax=Planktothricoides sp. SpSt-374 TaxID=2282167 RepID=A0A7C3VJQ3_9CYAN|nr:hypothetical protein [Oscillatoriaceae cyanobacterium M33_DOE_052]
MGRPGDREYSPGPPIPPSGRSIRERVFFVSPTGLGADAVAPTELPRLPISPSPLLPCSPARMGRC